MALRVFLTHNREDLEAYYGRALVALRALDVDIVHNPLERDLTTAELVDASAGCAVIVAHRATPGEAELFAATPDLIAFLRTAVDISTVDVAAASAAGVVVGHADKSFVASTAELAFGLLLDAARNISGSVVDYRAGTTPPQRAGRQIRGMTAAVVGYGAIGAYLADLLHAAGLDVVVCDPTAAVPAPYRSAALTDALAEADVVFPLVDSNPATEGLVDESAIATMPPGSILVNVSRGEIVDEAAVAAALDRGHLRAFACDVGSAPDQRPDPALAARPDVVATPHLGGLTPENADAQALSSVEQIEALLRGACPPRIANPEVWSA